MSESVVTRFGRKAAVLVFHAVKMTGCVLSIYAPNYELFTLSRFIIAAGSTAANLATLLIGTLRFSPLSEITFCLESRDFSSFSLFFPFLVLRGIKLAAVSCRARTFVSYRRIHRVMSQ